MSRRRKTDASNALLDMWRPPTDAGEPIGCITSTYTFTPTLFEEWCLARFLGLDSDVEREGLAYLLEREQALGSCYAGVLVDHRFAGVPHSLRWDVLSVRIPSGKQHAKLSILAWSRAIRVILASANLTDAGYRSNQEVAVALDLRPDGGDVDLVLASAEFLADLLGFTADSVASTRAARFLEVLRGRVQSWSSRKPHRHVTQRLVCTLPASGKDGAPRSAAEEALAICRSYGGVAPYELTVASPFFDQKPRDGGLLRLIGSRMARGVKRHISLHVPVLRDAASGEIVRVQAPDGLPAAAAMYADKVTVEALPDADPNGNPRPWHAKMMRFADDAYAGLMIGSSNFTSPGLGVGANRNAEANLLTVARDGESRSEKSALRSVWPETERLEHHDALTWEGVDEDAEEADATIDLLPDGFISALFAPGDVPMLHITIDPARLPDGWSLWTTGPGEECLVSHDGVPAAGVATVDLRWMRPQPPDVLQARWGDGAAALMAVNVDDATKLPPPVELASLTSAELLRLLASTNPAAALRAMLGRNSESEDFDGLLDAAAPIDLDPLRRHRLADTFLQRVRARARDMIRMRERLQSPVYSDQALEWRLVGIVGPREYARKLLAEQLAEGDSTAAVLAVADLVIVLHDVRYEATPGALSVKQFQARYREFFQLVIQEMDGGLQTALQEVAPEVRSFWAQVITRCA